jgi:hypothetical protein
MEQEDRYYFEVPDKTMLRLIGVKDIPKSLLTDIGQAMLVAVEFEMAQLRNVIQDPKASPDYLLMNQAKQDLLDWMKSGHKPLKLIDKIMRPIMEMPMPRDSSLNLLSRRWIGAFHTYAGSANRMTGHIFTLRFDDPMPATKPINPPRIESSAP